jgi:molybdopterin molybdotransferase
MHHFALGRISHDAEGRQVAHFIEAQAAYRIVPYTRANTWLSAADRFVDTADAWPIDPADAA